MKKIIKGAAFALTMIALLASCGSSSEAGKSGGKKSKYDAAAFEKAYKAGDFEACLGMLESRGSDSILTGLDSSMLHYLKKDYAASGREFTTTQSEMNSVSKDMTAAKTMEAALISENSVTYSGATYERILAYSMKAVDSFKMGNVPSAVGVMNDYTGNYKEEIAALVAQQKELAKSSDGITNDPKVSQAADAMSKAGVPVNISALTSKAPAASSAVYEASPFLAYLGTLAYAANGDSVHAKDFASVLKSTNAAVDVSEDLTVPAGKGRLDVIALTDKIGQRTQAGEQELIGQIGNVFVNFKVVYPVFGKQNHSVSVKNVTLSNGESKSFTLVEDFDKAVKADVESKARGAYNRSLFRNITKNSAAVVAGVASLKGAEEALNKAQGNALKAAAAQKAYEVAVTGVNKTLIEVVDAEKADVRQASYFPNKASAAGFTVAPGTYSVTVEYSDGTKDVIQNISVVAGKPTVVVSEKMN